METPIFQQNQRCSARNSCCPWTGSKKRESSPTKRTGPTAKTPGGWMSCWGKKTAPDFGKKKVFLNRFELFELVLFNPFYVIFLDIDTLHCLHDMTLRCTALLHYIKLRYSTIHYITAHTIYINLHTFWMCRHTAKKKHGVSSHQLTNHQHP